MIGISILIFFFGIIYFPNFVSAHAYIVKSTPYENQSFPTPPSKILIQFDESIQTHFHSIKVFNEFGDRVDIGKDEINKSNHSIIETKLIPDLPLGNYQVKWNVVSSDGHPVQGVISFNVGNIKHKPNNIQNADSYVLPHSSVIGLNWLEYISLLFFIGLLFFCLILSSKKQKMIESILQKYKVILLTLFFFITVSILLSLLIETINYSNQTVLHIFKKSLLMEVIKNTKFGNVWIIQLLILLILGNSLYMANRKENKHSLEWWISSFFLGIFLLLSKAFIGHAAMQNKFIPIVFDFLHLFAGAIWTGGLIGIGILYYKLQNKQIEITEFEAWQVIQRFSYWAGTSVAVLFATGLYGSFKYVPTIHALFNTAYGKVLIAKMILFVIMLLFGMIHFFKSKNINNKIGKTIWIQLSVGVIVLGLSALLTNLPTAIESPGAFQDKKVSKGYSVELTATPNRVGNNTFTVKIKDKKDDPVTSIQQVSITFKSLEMDMGENTVIAKKDSSGKYVIKGIYTNMAGKWKIKVHVLTTSLNSLDCSFKLIVGNK